MIVFVVDLLQVYEMVCNGDLQFFVVELICLYDKEGVVQVCVVLLLQINGEVVFNCICIDDQGFNIGSIISKCCIYIVMGSQMLFNWLQFVNLWLQCELSKVVDFILDLVNDDLIVCILVVYFNVLVGIELLLVVQINEVVVKKQFDFVDKCLEVGLVLIIDVYEVCVQYDQVCVNMIIVQNILVDVYQVLIELIGQLVIDLCVLLVDFCLELLVKYVIVDQLVSEVVVQNFVLKVQELKVSVVEFGVLVVCGGYYLILLLGGNYGKSVIWGDVGVGSGSFYNLDLCINSVGLILSVLIFVGGVIQFGVCQVLVQCDIVQDGYEQQKCVLDCNICNVYQILVVGISEVEVCCLVVVLVQSVYDVLQVGLEVGMCMVLDVIQNQCILFLVQLDYVNVCYIFLQNCLQLGQVIGMLDIVELQDINCLLMLKVVMLSIIVN